VPPLAALAAATREAAAFLGQSREWGTIKAGRRADLVLLSRNPLDDIRNTRAIELVVISGRMVGPQ
jgi:imidazolonepropionase-like amidohydrolase